MKTENRLEQVISNAQTLSGQLKSCAMDTDDVDVKEMYEQMHEQVEEMLPHLKGRLGHVRDEEPQYR